MSRIFEKKETGDTTVFSSVSNRFSILYEIVDETQLSKAGKCLIVNAMKKVSKPVFCSDSVVTIFQHHSLDQS
jgi:hypothetical protein